MVIFYKTDFLDLKYPPEVQVEPKTCSTIFRTPVPAILNHTNLTGLAGGAREGQYIAHLGHFNERDGMTLEALIQKRVRMGTKF